MTTALAVLPPGEVNLPAEGKERAVAIDENFKGCRKRAAGEAMVMAEWVAVIEHEQTWATLGFKKAGDYFESRGLAYRTAHRLMSIVKGIGSLPAAAQDETWKACIEVGDHKAEMLSSLMNEPGVDLQGLLSDAKLMTVEAFRDHVNDLKGIKRADASSAGKRKMKKLLEMLPPNTQEWAEAVVRGGMKTADGGNVTGVLILALELLQIALAENGVYIDVKPPKGFQAPVNPETETVAAEEPEAVAPA